MANLASGVHFRLFGEMGVEEKQFDYDDCRKPVLLQNSGRIMIDINVVVCGIRDRKKELEWVKHEINKSINQTVYVSSTRPLKRDSSDDYSSHRPRRKDAGFAMKSAKHSNQRRTTSSSRKNNRESLYLAMKFGLLNDEKGVESEISWDSLPSNLVKLGKDLLRQRDGALLTAVEALLEASAAERVLKCLRLIVQSSTKSGPPRTIDSDSNDPDSIKQVLKVGLDRKRIATSWIKAALESNLAPASASTGAENRSSTASHMFRHGRPGEFHVRLEDDKDNRADWIRGNALYTAAELTNSMQNQCRTWFLAYVEDYLDEVKSKSVFRQSDNQVAELMLQIKKMNGWLDVIVKKEGDYKDGSSNLRES
ncbi:hypothetical protein LWI28_003815 [Acer negundo]|uniref:DUF6857 domain-containing protein n=1 Tax=Acer negundo TaxID=4023 RepID=A0AAD5IYH5_ACENE|nr:hypothetical protein LWI28_003815 [Acer negundo]